jgi:hypothetical protein
MARLVVHAVGAMLRPPLATVFPHALDSHPCAFKMTGLATLMLFGDRGGLAAAGKRSELAVKRGTVIEGGRRLQKRAPRCGGVPEAGERSLPSHNNRNGRRCRRGRVPAGTVQCATGKRAQVRPR